MADNVAPLDVTPVDAGGVCRETESPLPEEAGTSKLPDALSRSQQWEHPFWDSRRSRERSVESRERSVDSRDSATRERDLRYAEERMRDRERGRREVVILYRGQDSESVHSDSTEEGEIKSPLKGSMLSTVGASFVSRVEKTKAELEDTMDLASDASCAETEQPVKVTAEDPPKLAKGSKKASASSHKVATKHTELVKETHHASCTASKGTEVTDSKVLECHRNRSSKDAAKG